MRSLVFFVVISLVRLVPTVIFFRAARRTTAVTPLLPPSPLRRRRPSAVAPLSPPPLLTSVPSLFLRRRCRRSFQCHRLLRFFCCRFFALCSVGVAMADVVLPTVADPLILRKSTAYEMWTILARMYGRKKRVLHTYQNKRSIYALRQGDSSVASFYAALKTKWEELDYHTNDDWKNASDQALYWEKEWIDRTFIFLGGLRDEFESIRSQLLNCDEIPGIEEVYARVEAEEQRRQIMHIDSSHGSSPIAFVSRTAETASNPSPQRVVAAHSLSPLPPVSRPAASTAAIALSRSSFHRRTSPVAIARLPSVVACCHRTPPLLPSPDSRPSSHVALCPLHVSRRLFVACALCWLSSATVSRLPLLVSSQRRLVPNSACLLSAPPASQRLSRCQSARLCFLQLVCKLIFFSALFAVSYGNIHCC
ncbi:hypothetical protein EJ110_NYTH59323 [Nymphaea thermarum]|nr:hypothetical protein EJ110_NYTH59323 [Nymphaea thermarum]